MKDQIKNIVLLYEDDKITFEDASERIKNITGRIISKNVLDNYWKGQSLDEFISDWSYSITDYQKVNDDKKALELINDILSNILNDSKVAQLSFLLEKSYAKSEGTIAEWIFTDDIDDANKILSLLKQDTNIYL